MKYLIRVSTTGDVAPAIELDGIRNTDVNGNIEWIQFFIDTVQENVSERSNSVLNKLEFQIIIDETTNQACKEFMTWALTSSGNTIKRTVDIKVETSENKLLRSFHLKEMFVEDFKEFYKGESKHFYIKLTQTQGHSNDFEHDTIPLV